MTEIAKFEGTDVDRMNFNIEYANAKFRHSLHTRSYGVWNNSL